MLFGISIHALHEESDVVAGVDEELCVISIHALHEESDFASDALHFGLGISIHALHEESDRSCRGWSRGYRGFQSTLSMRRATNHVIASVFRRTISIHALHEESDSMPLAHIFGLIFQSTLSMRRATWCWDCPSCCARFQSTLSMRRATRLFSFFARFVSISIHALHEESDDGTTLQSHRPL